MTHQGTAASRRRPKTGGAGTACLLDPGTWVNDAHAGLNATRVGNIVAPASVDALTAAFLTAGTVCISGSRHAMGGQQFATGTTLLDLRRLDRIVSFDQDRGLIEVEAGIQWPKLVAACQRTLWGIAQKQTGADNLTLGGSLAANVHGRGLTMKPLISDIESFELLDARGDLVRCSRTENAALFRLVIGGYGLFGIVVRVTLRLVPRQPVRRLVEIVRSDTVIDRLASRTREGCLYGDFQFNIDERSPDFLQTGVLSCYLPTAPSPGSTPKSLTAGDWLRLLRLACTNRSEGFRQYTAHYLSTDGQVFWSDTHQLGPYVFDDAHLSAIVPELQPASLMITELFVPRDRLGDFLHEAARTLRSGGAPVVYGTVRLIERDDESFLAWARQPYACIIFNLLVRHTASGLDQARAMFRALIDLAIVRGGSYYLTYHRFATRLQVETCHPQFPEFLALKDQHDPEHRFASDWHRHHRALFGSGVGSAGILRGVPALTDQDTACGIC